MQPRRPIIRRVPPEALGTLPTDLHPVLARVLAARGVTSARELEHSLDRLHPASLLSGIEGAIALLEQSLIARQRILIVADFDTDGATSCALAVRALRLMGAHDIHYIVPSRFHYGYGLTPEIVAVAAAKRPDLLVTVDNGISSIEGVQAAREKGMQVLITDHHLPGESLPDAHAIVNPNLRDDAFPSKHLAGVGVVFYVMLALRARLRESGWFRQRGIEEPKLAQLLDLVALGTVADVVTLDHNNRILVEQGLRRIRAGHCVPGIRALLEVGGRDYRRAVAADLAFAVAPRLNAAGRLDDMSLGVECLLSGDTATVLRMASQLDELNSERRAIEADMQAQALSLIAGMHLEDCARLPMGLCLFDEGWHQGVIGILASRIKDRWHRPVIAFAPADGNELKGSARSIPGFHIRDALAAVAGRDPGLVNKFGGHAMAAGLALDREALAAFSVAFEEEARARLAPQDLESVIHSDGELSPDDLGLELAQRIRRGGPWGQGFPEPVFDGRFQILQRRAVGGCHLRLSLRVPGSRLSIDAIAFNTDDTEWPSEVQYVDVAYRLDVNEYRGQESAQLVLEYVAPVPA